ncbi:MAG: hypothetical protein VXW27_10090, partial [Pseudomonadota bacterium]|nr:hypothetical protein [Pseudomonadota bacterium]
MTKNCTPRAACASVSTVGSLGLGASPGCDVYVTTPLSAIGAGEVAPLPDALPSASRYFGGVVVEKPGGGPIFGGNTISLRGCNGYCIDVDDESVAARWTIAGEWQAL